MADMWVVEGAAQDGTAQVTFRISAGAVRTIGRATRADFVVDAPLVSRLHCRITAAGDGVLLVEDLGSTNGTYVNGERITSHQARDGDRIGVGRVDLVAVLARATAPPD